MIKDIDDIVELFDEFYFINEVQPTLFKENEIPFKINFEGGNDKGIIFVFSDVLQPNDTEMIHKLIHNAMKIKLQDVALVVLSQNETFSLSKMINVMDAKKVILWGTSSWSSIAKTYTIHDIENVMVLAVDDVSMYHQNTSLKTSLWKCIQSFI